MPGIKYVYDKGLGRFINPKYLRMFGYPEIERLSPKGWAEYFEVAISTGKPEPYGRNSNVAYAMMTFPLQEAEQLMLNNLLPEDTTEFADVYVANLETGDLEIVSVSTSGEPADGHCFEPVLSADARYVAFSTSARTSWVWFCGSRRRICSVPVYARAKKPSASGMMLPATMTVR